MNETAWNAEPAKKLRMLADWFDMRDGNGGNDEVQRDLRAIALMCEQGAAATECLEAENARLRAWVDRLRTLLESEAEDAAVDAAVDALAVEHLLREAGLDWTDIPTAVEQLIQGGLR